MATKRGSDMFEQMWATGEWSDLTIIADGKSFKVHKNVVCHGCPFLKAACTRDWQEARTGIINLPEDSKTIEELLRHLYGLGMLWMEVKSGKLDAHELLGFRIVADKYQIDSFLADTEEAFVDAIDDTNWGTHPALLIDLGTQIYDLDRPTVGTQSVLESLLMSTAVTIHIVLKDASARDKLVSHAKYHDDLMRFMGARTSETCGLERTTAFEWASG